MTIKPTTKGFLIGVAATLAVLGAYLGVKSYVSNITIACAEDRATVCESNSIIVIVSTQDIPPNKKLDPLINSGVFRAREIPIEALVENAVTTTDQLRGLRSRTVIYAGEQILLPRVGEGSCHNAQQGQRCWGPLPSKRQPAPHV